MIPSLTALLSSVAGKVALGVVVATTSVGAAAAAGAEIPFVPQERPPVEESTAVEEPTVAAVAVEEQDADQAAAALQVEEPAVAEEESDEVDEVAEDTSPDPTHGEIVSTFTRSTELEGCEKGQATAAVARGDVVPAEDGTVAEDDLAPYLEKCLTDDGDEPETDDAEETEEADEASENHGAVVSTFAHETDLEGCERGQAVAAVARGDVVPADDGTVAAKDLEPYLEKCRGGEDPESDDADTEEIDTDSDGPPARAGKPARPQIHVHLRFAERVAGPVLLGAGRFLGYGLCRPISPARNQA